MILGVTASSIDKAINYSIANASYSGNSFDPVTQMSTTLEDIYMGGGKMFLYGNAILAEYSMTDTEDVSTGSFTASVAEATAGQGRAGINASANGTNWILCNFGSTSAKNTMSTGFDISTLGSRTTTGLSGTTGTNARGWSTNAAGTKLWGINSDTNVVYEFDISPAWTGTPTYNSASKDLSANLGQAYGMAVSPDGKYMIIGDNTGDTMKQFSFGTIDDITTLAYDSIAISVSGQDTAPYGFAYSEGGTAINMIGIVTDKVYQYNLNN